MDFLFPHTEGLNTFLNWDSDMLATHVHVQRDASRNVQSLFIYREPAVKASIQALKYKRNVEVAKLYAPLLAKHIQQTVEMHGALTWLIIPIPASKRRIETHGFNQCEILCEALVPLLDSRCVYRPDILERVDSHTSQTKLARSERLQNVQHVFRIREMAEHDASVVRHDTAVMIIDDVYTTGATAYAAIETCRKAGFGTVVVWTLAH